MVLNKGLIEFVIFGKRASVGQVKTRLFPKNPRLSCEFYVSFLKDFSTRFIRYCDLPIRPLIEDTKGENFLEEYFPGPRLLTPIYQEEGSLFKRLERGLSQIESPFFYLTGTDLPHFPFQYLDQVVVGPDQVSLGLDKDGGFYFFAGPKESASVFSLEPQTNKVGQEVLDNFTKSGYKVNLIEEWSDIDTLSDLKDCLENPRTSNDLPATNKLWNQVNSSL